MTGRGYSTGLAQAVGAVVLAFLILPILAVVPDNRDPKLRVDEPHPHFWEEVRKWQSWGWTIGLHGYQHAYVTTDAGCMGINRYSEFAGLPASEQREKLRRGIAIFRKEGITPDLWIAPAHSFDTHTLEALQAEGVDVVSDGFFPAPGRDRRGIFWAPQQMWWFANRRRGVWTVCLHHNEWTQARLEQFRDEVKRRFDQGFLEVAMMVAASPRMSRPAHVNGHYMSRGTASTASRLYQGMCDRGALW